MNDVVNLLMNHKSIRKFSNKSIDREIVNTMIRCGQCAPTSSHFQTYTIIEVQDPEKRSFLSKVAGDQRWVKEAPLVLLFCVDLRRGQKYFENVDAKILGNTEAYTVGVVDTALLMGRILIAAQSLGLGGVVVGGIRNDIEGVWKEFELPEMIAPLFLLCLGYPDEDPGIKPRLPQEEIHKIDLFDDKDQAILINDYNETILKYYTMRSGGEIEDNWTRRCGSALSAKPRFQVGHFLKSIGLLKE
jgi:nitroreductase